MENKQLYWTATGSKGKLKSFDAVEGFSIDYDKLQCSLFAYENKKDELFFICEVETGISISRGKELKYAIEYLDEIIEKQGSLRINEKINEYKKGSEKVPSNPPVELESVLMTNLK